jgi:LacI family transcriptional regulator
VLRKAAELGYRPDPHLDALARYRRTSKSARFVAKLAWLTNYPERESWRGHTATQYHRGAQQRAQQLGYELETFWMAETGLNPARLRQILLTRGIRGLLLAPQVSFGVELDFDFSEFAAVTFGYTLCAPALHLVSNHQYRSMAQALRRLLELGYERVGVALVRSVDARVDHNFIAGYFATVHTTDGLAPIAPYECDEFNADEFDTWQRRMQPDALILSDVLVEPVRKWARKAGRRLPHDLALAGLDLGHGKPGLAGIDQRSEAIGAAACDVLAGTLGRFEYGLPVVPLRVLIEGVWVDGASAPRRAARRPRL